jgi:hypothetical protein
MEPLDVVSSTYLACLVDVVGIYSGATPTARPLSATRPVEGTNETTLATLVRFGEERLWGSSLLVADEDAVAGLGDGSVADLSDWLGELNNQLVGRMKNRLLGCAVSIQVSPPVPVIGFVKDRRAAAGWEVEWPGGRLTACLGLTIAPGVVLAADGSMSEVALAEGTLCLF